MKNSVERTKRTNRLGEKRIMNCGEEAEIIKYNGCEDIQIMFIETKEMINCQYFEFKRGEIQSHFSPTVCGIGIVGLEKTRMNGKQIKSYDHWRRMITRCYSEKNLERSPTYKDCTVCEEWLFYPNFKKWYDENYYEIEGQKMALDKDILVKSNKIYSPETCIFVPNNINNLFVKNNVNRGDLPIGVIFIKENSFRASCNDKFSRKTATHLGYYKTPEDAFYLGYKPFKENHIKEIAEQYKGRIPNNLYKAMYNWKVEITD